MLLLYLYVFLFLLMLFNLRCTKIELAYIQIQAVTTPAFKLIMSSFILYTIQSFDRGHTFAPP